MRKQQRALKKAELKYKDALPELMGMIKEAKGDVSIRYFEGHEGAKQVYNDTLTAATELKGFSNIGILSEYIKEDWLDDYRKRKSDMGLTGRFIVADSPNVKEYIKEKYIAFGLSNLPEARVLASELFTVFAEMDMYNDKVSIISLSKEEQMGLIIESKIVARSFEGLFNVLWQIAEKI